MIRPSAVLIGIVLIGGMLAAIFVPFKPLMDTIHSWIVSNPSPAVISVTAFITVGILLLLPLSLMFMLSGLLFGLLKGFIVAWVALMMASSTAFWMSRSIARPWIEEQVRGNALFTSIDHAVRRNGFHVTLLTRLVMVIPYQFLNYSLGLTQVRFRDMILATCLGSVPVVFLFVYLGTTVDHVADIVGGNVEFEGREFLIGAIVIVATVSIIVLVTRKARTNLKEALFQFPVSGSEQHRGQESPPSGRTHGCQLDNSGEQVDACGVGCNEGDNRAY